MAVYSEGLNRQYIKCSHVPGDKKIKKKTDKKDQSKIYMKRNSLK